MTDALNLKEKSENDSGQEWNSEEDSFDVWKQWQELAVTALANGLQDVFADLLVNIKKGHLPSLKMLMYLVELPHRKRPMAERVQLSLAGVLWTEFNALKHERLALEGVVLKKVEDVAAGDGGGGLDPE